MPLEKIHGQYSLRLFDHLMLTIAEGPWNEECVRKFHQDYALTLSPLGGEPWGDLVILHGESLLIPSAENLLRQIVAESYKKGLLAVAMVISNSIVQNTTRAQFEYVYQDAPVRMAFFSSAEQGLDWLIAQGFHADREAILAQIA